MLQKRNLSYDESSDKDSIINDEKILSFYVLISKNEYDSIYPVGNYMNYLKEFFKDGVIQAFKRFGHTGWFKNRYINKKDVKESGTSFDNRIYSYTFPINTENFYFCRSKGIHKNLKEEVEDMYTHEGVLNVYEMQTNVKNTVPIDFYVQATGELDIKDKELLKIKPIKEVYRISNKKLKAICTFIFNLNGKKHENIENLSAEEITFMLRKDFNFCTSCCRQFDSVAEMIDKCPNHKFNDSVKRQLSILADLSTFDFKSLDYNFSKSFVENYIRQSQRNEYECIECHKFFDGVENIKSHLENKHSSKWSDIKQQEDAFETFTKKIDFFILKWICQFDTCKTRPKWTYTKSESNHVKYDLKHFYSKI
ncbi:hypothetical protein EHP00_77 [Ecytonucleospora hepatopenaei]|uniref:C2H2-type domain-containing protein n=1 Tax=Ecytonucleospora hepatopenaei TaxID=646526 RepID=A0A1W0E5V3_9MICR|nr:hypothetical protein EHP00_77 [Ecytonucleospora hepatopenaei]